MDEKGHRERRVTRSDAGRAFGLLSVEIIIDLVGAVAFHSLFGLFGVNCVLTCIIQQPAFEALDDRS